MRFRISASYIPHRVLFSLLVLSIFASAQAWAGKPGSRGGSKVRSGYKARTKARTPQARNLRRSLTKPNRPPTVSVKDAMKLIRSGQRVLLPTEAAASQILVDALVKRSGQLRGKRPVEVFHTATKLNRDSHVLDANPAKLKVNALFISGAVRKHVDKIKVTPTYLGNIPYLLDKKLKPHVVLLRVSPPDKKGYVSTGPSAGLITDLLSDPRVKVIAEVNPNVPRTRGHSRVHISHIDRLVQSTEAVQELRWPATTSVNRAIGRNVAREIPHGSTLQLGIGPLQKAVAEQVASRGKSVNNKGGKYKLKIRSEMIDDGLVAMAKAGVISGSSSSIQLGFAVGTRKLYDFLQNDKRVKMVATRKINDVHLAGKRNKLMAINSGVAVDLYGQACSEMVPRKQPDGSIKPQPYSGVGGQVDFFRAVQRSKGGKGFLTMRSTAKGGALSTISLDLPRGLVVTTNRYDMDRVATEWGVTKSLRGLDTVARAQELIKVAHPKFRQQLATKGLKRFGGDPAAWKQATSVTKRELKLAQGWEREAQVKAAKCSVASR